MAIIDLKSERKLLLVEDEPAISELLEVRLTSLGFRVYQASNEGEALHLARAYSPHLVLSDTRLKSYFGPRMIPDLREQGYQGLVYSMSMDPEAEIADNWLEAGAKRYFPKKNLLADAREAAGLIRGDLESSGRKY